MTDKLFIDSKSVQELIDTAFNMYRLGWDERNGGNISYLVHSNEVNMFPDSKLEKRIIPVDFDISELKGDYFLITGSGKYFKNVKKAPKDNIGLIKVNDDGKSISILWGLENNAIPTSELPTHLMSHIARRKVDNKQRVVIHSHPTHLIAMSFVHKLNEKKFTKCLWQMISECLVVFPDGISIVPWMVPGTVELGEKSAEKLNETRLVLWPHHGIFGVGNTLDETFGLIETAEKAAQIWMLSKSVVHKKSSKFLQIITDKQLLDLAKAFNVTPRKGFL
jgi:rhamnulose-1-phosphate aldolase